MLDEIHFLDRQHAHMCLVNQSKIYLNGYYWHVTPMGTEKRDSNTDELLDCVIIDKAVTDMGE